MSEPPPPPTPRMADLAKTDQEHFRFFDLPAELRENILEMALPDFAACSSSRGYGVMENGRPVVALYKWWRPPGILETSQQLRKEAGAIYFKRCEFQIEYADICAFWLAAMSEEFRSHISFLGYCRFDNFHKLRYSPKELLQQFDDRGLDMTRALKYCDCYEWYEDHQWKAIADAIKEAPESRESRCKHWRG